MNYVDALYFTAVTSATGVLLLWLYVGLRLVRGVAHPAAEIYVTARESVALVLLSGVMWYGIATLRWTIDTLIR